MSQPLDELKSELKNALVKHCRLNTRVNAAEIADDISLFADGLGLDSIDLLELIVHVEKTYGFKIRNDAQGRTVLQNIGTLATAISGNGASAQL
jgi:acyl carrier protein